MQVLQQEIFVDIHNNDYGRYDEPVHPLSFNAQDDKFITTAGQLHDWQSEPNPSVGDDFNIDCNRPCFMGKTKNSNRRRQISSQLVSSNITTVCLMSQSPLDPALDQLPIPQSRTQPAKSPQGPFPRIQPQINQLDFYEKEEVDQGPGMHSASHIECFEKNSTQSQCSINQTQPRDISLFLFPSPKFNSSSSSLCAALTPLSVNTTSSPSSSFSYDSSSSRNCITTSSSPSTKIPYTHNQSTPSEFSSVPTPSFIPSPSHSKSLQSNPLDPSSPIPPLPSHSTSSPPVDSRPKYSRRSSSLLSLVFTSPSETQIPLIGYTGESTTVTTLSCAYSQPFLINPCAESTEFSIGGNSDNSSANSLLRALDSISSAEDSNTNNMSRPRSHSVSSIGSLAKSPTSLMTSLSTSVSLYDSQEPKTLQDILLLAQSHYISHRYVPALILYKLAAEKHHSLPACCSLYALYTSTLNAQGLVKSDTKATQILIHALRIWTARRWSSSRLMGTSSTRSRTQDEIDELEEYFAHPRKLSVSSRRQSVRKSVAKIPIHSQSISKPVQPKNVAQSIESEYRKPFHLQDVESDTESVDDQDDSQDEDEDEDESEYDSEEEGDESYISYSDCEECDEEDEEAEKEEEARRIGLATDEIEDIVQKICSMIQKGVLGLDEPVLQDAVSSLRLIERGLSKEAEAWRRELGKSKSMFSTGSSKDQSNSSSSQPSLLLTQGVDLSFLNFSPEEDNGFSAINSQFTRKDYSQFSHQRSFSLSPVASEKSDPVNQTIANLPTVERDRDRALCRSIRIRIMFTLGWVHQQKAEYDYAAKAFGVCSEITSTGKRPLNIMQVQAKANIETCRALEKQLQEPTKVIEPIEIAEQRKSENNNPTCPVLTTLAMPPRTGQKSTSLETPSAVTPTSASTSMSGNHSEVSSPSSMTSSDSGSMSIRGSSVISSLSAAMWGSSFFKPSPVSTPTSETGPSTPKLHRSKSFNIESKLKSIETIVSPKETKEPQQQHHQHHPKQQHRTKSSRSSAPVSKSAAPVMTMSVHQKKAVKCGYCGQARILMPLCACKKVRYCNGRCRIADLETHRLTGCCATNIGNSSVEYAVSDTTSSSKSGITI